MCVAGAGYQIQKTFIRFKLLYIIMLMITYSSFAQDKDEDVLTKTESQYYISLRNHFSVYTHGITKLNEIELRDKESDSPIQYKPNENFNVGLGFNYKWLGVGAAFKLAAFNSDDDLYGKTESFDFQTDAYTKKLLMTANLQSYKGYYWDNVDEYDDTWDINDSVPQRPDIETFSLGFNLFYTANHEKFSLKASYLNTEWQKRSAGSFITGGQMSAYALRANEPVVPVALALSFPAYDSLIALNTVSIGTNFGYSYTLVMHEYFFVNTTLIFGLSLQAVGAIDYKGKHILDEVRLSGKSHFRLALGVNNYKSYGGISFVIDSYPIRNSMEESFIYKYGKVRLFYGRHISW